MNKELLEGILALARKRPLTEREVAAIREALRELAEVELRGDMRLAVARG